MPADHALALCVVALAEAEQATTALRLSSVGSYE
jgi:hypothetical protein